MSEKDRTKAIEDMNAQIKETFKDGTAKIGDEVYNIKFDITAEYNNDIETKDLGSGENIMVVDGKSERGETQSSNGKANCLSIVGKMDLQSIHEIGHMIGFRDRYSDYENPASRTNPKEWRSIAHDGYDDDVMGAESKNLNQSHYDDVVKYASFKLITAQNHLLPENRTNKTGMLGAIDSNTKSAVSPERIPKGWQPRQAQIK